MSTSKQTKKASTIRSRGAPRDPNGLVSTLERLSGICPLPSAMRDMGNKYLKSSELFEPLPGRRKESVAEKLARPGAHDLLMNALTLDEIFQGNTTLVVGILIGRVTEGDLARECEAARREVDRRAQIYGYWQQRMSGVGPVLQKANFRKERIATLLHRTPPSVGAEFPAPFALHAVRRLESIEQRPRLQGPTAVDLVEKADAYLSLGDFETAAARASQAIELEPENPRAWFVRVVATLKQRNTRLAAAQRHRIEATEMAEPMSAHESWAHESADDAGTKAADSQQTLYEIVPQALLYWPKTTWGEYEHHDWRRMLCALMLNLAFMKVQLGGYLGGSRQAFELNGFEEEWKLKLDAPERPRTEGDPGPECPLSKPELDALTVLFKEHDNSSHWVFPIGGSDVYAQDFRLLHLRWVLGNDGYEKHWSRASEDYRGRFPDGRVRIFV